MERASDLIPSCEKRIEKQTVVPPITGGVATERMNERMNAAKSQPHVTSIPTRFAEKRLHAVNTMQYPGRNSMPPRLYESGATTEAAYV